MQHTFWDGLQKAQKIINQNINTKQVTNMKTIYSFLFIFFISFSSSFAQDDLMDILDAEVEEEVEYIAYTFKSTHIVNGHSIERMKARQLDFRVNHRFGQLNTGAYEFWGLDNANINFSLDYGVTDWLMLGIRRGTYKKTYDGSLKLTLLRQSKGKKVMPVSLSYFGDMAIFTVKNTNPEIDDALIHRLSYTNQLLIARKISEEFSLQISPTFVHRNRVDYFEENDIMAIGLGGRYKITRRLSLTFEYFYTTHAGDSEVFFNPLALGFDLETGGHVFQLFLTNSQQLVEHGVIAQTQGDYTKGGIYFGFNISRVFAIGKAH